MQEGVHAFDSAYSSAKVDVVLQRSFFYSIIVETDYRA